MTRGAPVIELARLKFLLTSLEALGTDTAQSPTDAERQPVAAARAAMAARILSDISRVALRALSRQSHNVARPRAFAKEIHR